MTISVITPSGVRYLSYIELEFPKEINNLTANLGI